MTKDYRAAASAVVLASFAFMAGLAMHATKLTAAEAPPPFVSVWTDIGEGSGFHIGDGVFLTADHVVGFSSNIVLVAEGGAKRQARLLWRNDEHDVALIRIEPKEWVANAHLDCSVPARGTAVVAHGDPMGLYFSEWRGFIAGAPSRQQLWPMALPLDMTVTPGLSGGAVTSQQTGFVVAMVVGNQTIHTVPKSDVTTQSGIGLAIAGDILCMLLGRANADLPAEPILAPLLPTDK